MVHGSRALGWFNPLFFEPVGTSPHPAIWLRQVGLLSSQSEPWVDAMLSHEHGVHVCMYVCMYVCMKVGT